MTSGTYGLGRREPVYESFNETSHVTHSRTELSWQADLFQSQSCWYDLLMNPEPNWDGLASIDEQLMQMQDQARGRSDLCFIAFWVARPKVRFSLSKLPRYALMSNELVFYVEVAGDKEKKKLSTAFIDVQSRLSVKPHVEVNDRFITIYLPDAAPETVPIYDFLDNCGLDLRINSEIYAIAYTTEPLQNWMRCADRELTELLYNVPNEEHDFFFFCNQFQITEPEMPAGLISKTAGLETSGRRPLISADSKGLMLERALQTYFQTPQLSSYRPGVEAQALGTIPPQYRYIIDVIIDLGKPGALYRFSSTQVEASDKHIFTCEIDGDDVSLRASAG